MGSSQNMQCHLPLRRAISVVEYVLLVRMNIGFCMVGMVRFLFGLGLVGVFWLKLLDGWEGLCFRIWAWGKTGLGGLLRF